MGETSTYSQGGPGTACSFPLFLLFKLSALLHAHFHGQCAHPHGQHAFCLGWAYSGALHCFLFVFLPVCTPISMDDVRILSVVMFFCLSGSTVRHVEGKVTYAQT